MKNYDKNKMFTGIKAEKSCRTWSRGCLLCVVTALVSLIGTLVLRMFCSDPLLKYCLTIYILVGGGWLAVTLFLLSRSFSARTIEQTARELDEKFDGRNRLETAIELREREHPLKEFQRTNAEEFFKPCKTVNWGLFRYLFLLLIFSEAIAGILLWHSAEKSLEREVDWQVIERQKKLLEKQAKTHPKQQEIQKQVVKNETAKLKLTAPDAEIRKRPLDEIEWQGCADSPHGFSELKLLVYKNGIRVHDYPVGKNSAGNLKIDGVMALDEFDSLPYDLISYHLSGKTKVNGREIEVLSMPQFIEVRPFREDALDLSGKGGGGMSLPADVIVTFLNMQVMLHKTTFTSLIVEKMQPDKDLSREIRSVYYEQKLIYDKLRLMLDQGYMICEDKSIFELKLLPADSINSLEKAVDHMKLALADLKGVMKRKKIEGVEH